jgi:hypothetical protein
MGIRLIMAGGSFAFAAPITVAISRTRLITPAISIACTTP